MTQWIMRIYAAVLCSLVSMTSAVAGPIHAKPRQAYIESAACPFELSKDVAATPTAQGIECGTLHVPENRENPHNMRMIKVRYAVFRANGPKAEYQKDAVIIIPGGPGTSVFVSPESLIFAPFRRTRDFIAIDQRGNASSDPVLSCTPAMQEENLKSVKACAASLKARDIDLEGYDTTQSVADLIDLRRLLGRSPWNVLGISYSTFWAQAYAAKAPGDIRSLILDSPMEPSTDLNESAPMSRNALTKLFTRCASDPDCAKRYPDLENKYVSALRALKKRPAQIDGLRLSASDLSGIVYEQLYDTDQLKMFPKTIDLAFRKDYRSLADYVQWAKQNKRFQERGRQTGTSSGPVYLSVMCRDAPTTPKKQIKYPVAPWPTDIAALSRHEGWNLQRQCDLWPTRKASIDFPPLSHPALFLIGQLDPITPIEGAPKENDKTFITDFPLRSHGILLAPTDCAFGVIEQFLENPAKRPDDRCTAEMPSIRFD